MRRTDQAVCVASFPCKGAATDPTATPASSSVITKASRAALGQVPALASRCESDHSRTANAASNGRANTATTTNLIGNRITFAAGSASRSQ